MGKPGPLRNALRLFWNALISHARKARILRKLRGFRGLIRRQVGAMLPWDGLPIRPTLVLPWDGLPIRPTLVLPWDGLPIRPTWCMWWDGLPIRPYMDVAAGKFPSAVRLEGSLRPWLTTHKN